MASRKFLWAVLAAVGLGAVNSGVGGQPSFPPEIGAFATSRADRDRTLSSMRRLEAALGRAANGEGWLVGLRSGLDDLLAAMTEEKHELNRPDSLLAMIAAERPRRYSWRIRNLREQYDDIARQVSSLRGQLEDAEEGDVDPRDLRHRAGWIVRALQDCRARQTDLVFDALALDLGDVEPPA